MERNTVVNVTCRMCRQSKQLNVTLEDYTAWQGGKYAQYAFPYLTKGDRELLISGTCGPCFDKMWGDE